MQWTRRHFIELGAAAAAMFGLGAKAATTQKLEGRAYFDDWRALPGMKMTLHLDLEAPTSTQVTFVARHDGAETVIEKLKGSPDIEFRVPYIPTKAESYDLCAIVEDRAGRRCESETLEVLISTFSFGM